MPSIREEMKWGVPVFGEGTLYMVGLKNHVNLGFSLDALSAEELQLFDGKGNTMAHLEIREPQNIDEKRVIRLLIVVNSKNRQSQTSRLICNL